MREYRLEPKTICMLDFSETHEDLKEKMLGDKTVIEKYPVEIEKIPNIDYQNNSVLINSDFLYKVFRLTKKYKATEVRISVKKDAPICLEFTSEKKKLVRCFIAPILEL